MNKYRLASLVGAFLLAANAWAAGESPVENTQSGQSAGTIIVESAGTSAFYVSDTDASVGYASPVTIGVAGGSLREGKKLGIYNRGSKDIVIGTNNTNLTSPLTLAPKHSVVFVVTSKVWVSTGVKADEAPGTPGTGQVNVPPVSN